jgi:hypothetical protein
MMPTTTLEESLRAALTDAYDRFNGADAYLHSEVASADQALGAVTYGKANLTLVKLAETETSNLYYLRIRGGAVDAKDISKIIVPAKGYPIRIEDTTGTLIASCNEKESLSSYFTNLATNPDSPLITFAAYIMRKK